MGGAFPMRTRKQAQANGNNEQASRRDRKVEMSSVKQGSLGEATDVRDNPPGMLFPSFSSCFCLTFSSVLPAEKRCA